MAQQGVEQGGGFDWVAVAVAVAAGVPALLGAVFWPTRKEATDAIADYVAFHDHDRRHSRLGYHSPPCSRP